MIRMRPYHRSLMWLARRSNERELLEGEALDPGDVRANLRELARLNRLPGGIGASFAAIRHLTDPASIVTIADVGTGAGDMPAAFVRRARAMGASWRVTAIDSRPEVLEVALRRLRKVAAVNVLAGDARAIPLPDLSVDVAHASLLLHHFDEADAVAALREMARVSREGIVINDLRRGLVPYLLTWTTTMALTRHRFTRHDGPLSARRAYTLPELDQRVADAGLRIARRSSSLQPRVATAAVRAS
jgi:2-polyprenyl-3-methyl-5-hydroxy-6-metoxy-1,4-benzoquinol methylase